MSKDELNKVRYFSLSNCLNEETLEKRCTRAVFANSVPEFHNPVIIGCLVGAGLTVYDQ